MINCDLQKLVRYLSTPTKTVANFLMLSAGDCHFWGQYPVKDKVDEINANRM